MKTLTDPRNDLRPMLLTQFYISKEKKLDSFWEAQKLGQDPTAMRCRASHHYNDTFSGLSIISHHLILPQCLIQGQLKGGAVLVTFNTSQLSLARSLVLPLGREKASSGSAGDYCGDKGIKGLRAGGQRRLRTATVHSTSPFWPHTCSSTSRSGPGASSKNPWNEYPADGQLSPRQQGNTHA